MSIVPPSIVGEMITASTRRNLEAEWGLRALDTPMLDDIGAVEPASCRPAEKKNWLDAAMAVISESIGAAMRRAPNRLPSRG
jgi:hypothetical protein